MEVVVIIVLFPYGALLLLSVAEAGRCRGGRGARGGRQRSVRWW
jgi:hypothetical protein